jgi:hypothetical protein
MTTVAMNPSPRASAAILSRFFSTATFPNLPVELERSSEVTRSIIAVTANQRPMSDIDSGNLILVILLQVGRWFRLFVCLVRR